VSRREVLNLERQTPGPKPRTKKKATGVIERLGDYSHGQIVLAFVDGQRLVGRFERREGRLFLCPANSRYREIELDAEAQIFGRVMHSGR